VILKNNRAELAQNYEFKFFRTSIEKNHQKVKNSKTFRVASVQVKRLKMPYTRIFRTEISLFRTNLKTIFRTEKVTNNWTIQRNAPRVRLV